VRRVQAALVPLDEWSPGTSVDSVFP